MAVSAIVAPLVVGVTSHRNIPAREAEAIRRRVREFFAQLQHEFPGLPLVVLSALAAGGDQWVAEEALAAGAELVAPLPLPPAAYADDFTDAASRVAFAELCRRARVLQLPALSAAGEAAMPGDARDRHYAQAGIYIASHSHILLALWDGRESDLLGGTAQVVRYHLTGVMPGAIERRRGAQALLGRGDESLVYHIVCSRAGRDGVALPPLPPLQPLHARWLGRERVRAGSDGMPAEFRLMFTRMRQFDEDCQRHAERIRADAQAPDGTAAQASDDPIDGLFAAADWLARHFQRRVLQALRSIYVLATLMGIAFVCYSDLPTDLPYQDHAIYVFIVLFGAGVLVDRVARRRDWYRKYIDYRALAEGLRVQHWWREAGITPTSLSGFAHDNFMQKQDIELGWIRNVMRAASVRTFDDAAPPDAALARIGVEWIGAPGHGGQLDYYTRKSERRSRTQRLTRGLGRACLWTSIAISLLLALLQHRIGPDDTTSLVALMGTLTIIAAARESYAYRKGDKELIKQYRYMHGIFAEARHMLDRVHDANGRREILRALGEAALAEHAEWALMHRERPLENARF
jgi:hypothetical protein